MKADIEINPRWGVQVEGEEQDIVNLETYLKGIQIRADDYILWRLEDVPILRTMKWDKYVSANEVLPAAKEVVRLLSGCLNLLNRSMPLKVGTVYEFTSPLTFNMMRVTEINLTVREEDANKATVKDFERLVRLVDKHQWLAGCLPLLEPHPDWFACYKAIESIEDHLGGETKMVKSKIVEGIKLKRAKRMANSYRHFDNEKHQPPDPPVTLEDARNTVFTAMKSIVASL